MQVPTSALPDGSSAITYAFNVAMMTVNPLLGLGICWPQPPGPQWSIYAIAVYNLGGDLLINFAPDTPPSTYFATLRGPIALKGFGETAFVAGVVESAADETTSASLVVPDALKGLTLSDLQRMKTPFGRRYLELAQDFGTEWGVS